MDLILWRHAEAEDGHDDAARALTSRGVKQAERMARWLDARVSKSARLLVSPAVRAQQTARALARERETVPAVGTGAAPADVLQAAGWPNGPGTVVVVGHQPTLGAVAALVLTGRPREWRMKKGAIVWLAQGPGEASAVVIAALTPELL